MIEACCFGYVIFEGDPVVILVPQEVLALTCARSLACLDEVAQQLISEALLGLKAVCANACSWGHWTIWVCHGCPNASQGCVESWKNELTVRNAFHSGWEKRKHDLEEISVLMRDSVSVKCFLGELCDALAMTVDEGEVVVGNVFKQRPIFGSKTFLLP